MSHAKELTEQFNTFHKYDNVYDDDLDAWLHQSYADVIRQGKKVDWSLKYFSPSSSNACPRALYHKAKKHKKDSRTWQPHQRRWVEIGTAIGDVVQRELLLMGRHYKKFTGEVPKYTVGMVDGKPAFEDFVFEQKKVEHDGELFSLIGTTDGLLTVTGSDKIVGLEVKTKQQSPSTTSLRAMKEPKVDHVKQCIAYSIMYDVDEFVIAYVNTSHKAWFMTEEDFAKTPDIRMFDVKITQEDKDDLLDFFADIARRVNENDPPLPDLRRYAFNEYKDKIAQTITDGEIEQLEMVCQFLQESKELLPWEKQSAVDALNDIKRGRAKL